MLYQLKRGIVKITGADAYNFLQKLITADLDVNKTTLYSCLLNNKGKYDYDFFISKIDDYFLIDIDSNEVQRFLQTLKTYKLIAKVNLEHVENLSVVVVESSSMLPEGCLCSYSDRLLDFTRCIVPSLDIESNNTEYNYLRYKMEISESAELIVGKSIPLQCGMEELGAISFNKGCYLGQEFTNSSKHRMSIRHRIVPLKIVKDINPLQKLNTIYSQDLEVGCILGREQDYVVAFILMKHNQDNLLCNGSELKCMLPSWITNFTTA